MQGFELTQQQKQTQIMALSQKQIQSLKYLELKTSDLREAIYKEAELNPVLIVEDTKQKSTGPRDYTKLRSNITKYGQEASETFQKTLEASIDNRTSLYDHLLQQFNVVPNLLPQEYELGKNLIYNLDEHGFHILAPESFVKDTKLTNPEQSLKKVISIIQQLDPVGTCTKNISESLYVQAKENPKSTDLELFILSGNLNLIDPPKADKAVKKITAHLKENEKLFAAIKLPISIKDVTEESVQKAIDLIRLLDPNPTRDFSTREIHYIAPDIYVKKLEDHFSADDFAKGIITGEKFSFQVYTSHESLPSIHIDSNFSSQEKLKNLSEEEAKNIKENVLKAKDFINTIQYRQNTLLESACYIVKSQIDFFENGKGHLAPLTQKDIAKKVGVHEATISRMANSKYIQCEWGLFDIKYFFVTAAPKAAENSGPQSSSLNADVASRDNVLHAIEEILKEHAKDTKPLSDQKLSDALLEKGFKIARRTVAKYRTLLNINSSYNR